jgi:hypothetical protein
MDLFSILMLKLLGPKRSVKCSLLSRAFMSTDGIKCYISLARRKKRLS